VPRSDRGRWYHGGVLAVWLLVALSVRSAGDCPAAGEVERQLGPLLGDDAAARDVATIGAAADGSVSLSLADPSGQPIGARTLPRAGTCDEQAKTVAVTLAVWEAQLHPQLSLALDRLASSEPPPPTPRADVVVARAAPSPPAPASPALALTFGLVAVGDRQSGSWAPGARGELGLGPAGAGWRARLAVAGVARHQMNVAPGTVSWWRAFLALGAEADVARGRRAALVVGAAALGGVASIAGSNFPVDHATRSLDLGGEARARVEATLGAGGLLRPWVGLAAAMWVRRQGLDIEGTSSTAALPRVEPTVALGADFVW